MPLSEQQYQLYINGRSVPGEAAPFSVLNPASGKPLAESPAASPAQVEAAIAAARQAQPGWAALSDQQRRAYIERAAERLIEHSSELAKLITLEQGKPLDGPGSRFEMQAAVAWTQSAARTEIGDERVYEDASRKDVLLPPAWRGGLDHALELASDDRRLARHASAEDGQFRGHQTLGIHPAGDTGAGTPGR